MKRILLLQSKYFNTGKTRSIAFRKEALKRLYRAVTSNKERIYCALKRDLNKSESESYLTEIQIVLTEIQTAISNLERWSRPEKVRTPITNFPALSYIYREPHGKVLILSPWNYPFQLALVPLVGAIAGGNCVILKPSKSSVHVSAVLKSILDDAFPKAYVHCLSQGHSYEEILAERYDLIFFTGSERVGRIVMQAAAVHLTPVVLELGGKSPCIVEKTADVKLAAKRIAWGKFLNAGQTCVAPDYVLVDQAVKDPFIRELRQQIQVMYGNALYNPDYPKIINESHCERLVSLLRNESNKIGGKYSLEECSIEPTIFPNAGWEDEVMKNEIFGPILPIISYNELDAALAVVKGRAKPLACYLFTRDKQLARRLVNNLSFGGGCINDVIMHLANHHLPFGGVGSSGMGNYHGVFSYRTFTREKGVLIGKNQLDIPLRYPPYSKKKLNLIKFMTK